MKTLWFAIGVLAVAGCGPDLGECPTPGDAADPNNAGKQYDGQMLINGACVSCHSASNRGVTRNGAPAGMNFDAPSPGAITSQGVQLLTGGLANIREYASDIYGAIQDGTMPAAAPNLPARPMTAEDQVAIREWLACGAPVLASNFVPEIVNPTGTGLETAFASMKAKCAGCHNPTLAQGGYLLGGDVCAAYNNLLAGPSASLTCGGNGLIVPGNPGASLLLSKMTATPACGVSMPQGATPFADSDADAHAALTQWVIAGAPKPANCP